MAERFRYPTEVPVLGPNDMCKESYFRGDKCCLMGALRKAGLAGCAFLPETVRAAARAEIAPDTKKCFFSTNNIIIWNDDRRTTRKAIARAYNRITARLGYVVGNPEAAALARKGKVSRR